MKIVIDGFGGDNAPDEVLKGAALAVKELGIDIAITGDEKILMERMKALDISDSHLELVHAEGVITTEDAPKSVIKENSGTSMGKALYYLAEGNADAFISAGSTAAIVVGVRAYPAAAPPGADPLQCGPGQAAGPDGAGTARQWKSAQGTLPRRCTRWGGWPWRSR